ncbi:M6 family metalloprotease domain-containing protein [Mycoplasmatota bacterium]|nr:M6 family metalloprotease domain-containing protein [Mycoplasmatota bacterium]
MINKYIVEFIDYDNTIIDTIEVEYGESVDAPDNLQREGYIFTGWDKSLKNVYTNTKVHATYIPNNLLQAIEAFEFIFEEGDTALGVKGQVIKFNQSYSEYIKYHCISSDDSIISFNPLENEGVVNHTSEDQVVKVTVYASIDLGNDSYYELSKEINITVLKNESIDLKVDKDQLIVEVDESMQDAVDKMYHYYGESETSYLLPSKGNVNLLVIPIQFPNDKFTNNELARINYGFFGDGDRYETLKSYYYKSSYGTLNLSGDVLKPYTAQYNYNYYQNYTSQANEDASGVDLLIEESVRYYLQNNPNLDLSIYDSEGDGYIDGIHLVYSAPIDYNSEDIFFWAIQYYYFATAGYEDSDYVSWDNYEINSYVFSSVDFFYEGHTENAWTIIHETGHLLGLEDYYDYTPNEDLNEGGLGSADMMDSNSGDHNPFSKLILDWIDPIVVTKSCTVTIDKFDTSGDTIIVSNQFDSIFDEYFIMSFYTPTGLNEENQYLTKNGLLMYHVDAKLPTNYDDLSEYSLYLEYNNSDSVHKLIKIEEADGNNSISNQLSTASNRDLLQIGDSYNLKMYNETSFCEVKVLYITDDTITLSFTFQ